MYHKTGLGHRTIPYHMCHTMLAYPCLHRILFMIYHFSGVS